MLALAGVLLLLIAAETFTGMANAEPGEGAIFDIVYAFSVAVLEACIIAAVASVLGAMVYLLTYLRGVRITLSEAIFNRAVVLAAAVAALVVFLR
jgi:hypothetical protein